MKCTERGGITVLRSVTGWRIWQSSNRPNLIGSVKATFSTGTFNLESNSKRWVQRQRGDPFVREAKLRGKRSRAIFKLAEIQSKYNIFKPGMTVVDLGFAPGSWTQFAVECVRPKGRVLGIDLLPCTPPKGSSAIQGDFLSRATHDLAREYLRDPTQGRVIKEEKDDYPTDEVINPISYIDMERHSPETGIGSPEKMPSGESSNSEQTVDVLLSDMSEPWPQTYGFWANTLSAPYRMANMSGNKFRDHAASMVSFSGTLFIDDMLTLNCKDLCLSAFLFGLDTLKPGGSFVCKFFAGEEDKEFEKHLKKAFHKVMRSKPEASRNESREMYFVAIGRKPKATRASVFDYEE